MGRQGYRGEIHPHTIKYLQMGHPWIIKDRFTEKFPPQEKFIIGLNKGKPEGLFIHDFKHKKIKARLWSREGNFEKQIESFTNDLVFRLTRSIAKRKKLDIFNERENFYLVFGEGDSLPGLYILILGGEILIQYYSFFWEKYEKLILDVIKNEIKINFNKEILPENIWIQIRSDGSFPQEGAKCLDLNIQKKSFEIKEFGIHYKLKLGSRYDIGIYTDMSAIRGKIKKHIHLNDSFLNLFCYTGAFSLMALKSQCRDVYSVDISEKYLSWLDENIKMNTDLDSHKHHLVELSSADFINKTTEKFNIIVVDPPSFSSDGSKQSNSLDFYEKHIQRLLNITQDKGKLFLFLNTHSITRGKFKQKMNELILNKAKIIEELSLSDDCPRLPGFPEGDYLKGLVVEKL